MNRSDVEELHYICHVKNLVSICTNGILSHNEAKKKHPKSVADPIIQEKRKGVKVPGIFEELHNYANLYFNARNAMMYKILHLHESLCVIRVSTDVLDEPNVLITDRNASSKWRRFHEPKWGLAYLEKNLVFAQDWRHEDTYEYWRRKSSTCAEVLVPTMIPIRFFQGIYVSCDETKQKVVDLLNSIHINLPVVVNYGLFFR